MVINSKLLLRHLEKYTNPKPTKTYLVHYTEPHGMAHITTKLRHSVIMV